MPSAAGPWINENNYFCNFTDNQFVTVNNTSSDNIANTVRNPATQDIIGHVPETTQEEFNVMVAKAGEAFQSWSQVPVQQRQRVMLKLQHLIREHNDQLAGIVTAENGKTTVDANGDVFRGLEIVETAGAAVAFHMQGNSLRQLAKDVDCISYRRPLGVVAGLCPFNFPAM
jgi:malonate-semialdehyde dehydrogenase (acetylating)/methylmalonate-semialdehyde dehydrogenase